MNIPAISVPETNSIYCCMGASSLYPKADPSDMIAVILCFKLAFSLLLMELGLAPCWYTPTKS